MKVVLCERVADLDEPAAGSIVLHCLTCGVAVWFDVTGDLDLAEVRVYCEACCPAVGPIMLTAGQVGMLRAGGLDDAGIARFLAIARLTGGNPGGVAALADRVRSDPGMSRRFDEAVITAARDLVETGRLDPTRPGCVARRRPAGRRRR